jgi:hypothetical protein
MNRELAKDTVNSKLISGHPNSYVGIVCAPRESRRRTHRAAMEHLDMNSSAAAGIRRVPSNSTLFWYSSTHVSGSSRTAASLCRR